MSSATTLLADGFARVRDAAHAAVDGLTERELAWRADEGANSIGWLVWHLARVQDDHLAGVAGAHQVWTARGWAERFNLPFDDHVIGYGQSSEQAAQVRGISAELFVGYLDEVHEQTVRFLEGLTGADFDRVVDESWDPPVTLGVRVVSVLNDDLQHVGQAAFVRGLVLRRR